MRPLLLALSLSACIPKHELAADRARKAGDVATAAAEYELALQDTPMMDFEFERARDKRKKLLEGEWSPKLDAALAGPEGPEKVQRLLIFRRQARDAKTTRALAARTEEALLARATPEALRAQAPDEVQSRFSELVELYRTAADQRGPQAVADGIAAALQQSLALGLPASELRDGTPRLAWLLAARAKVRAAMIPDEVDDALDPELTKLQGAGFPSHPPGRAAEAFSQAAALRDEAWRLGAPPAAREIPEHWLADTVDEVATLGDASAREHHYILAFDQLAPYAAQVTDDGPVRARLAAIRAEGAKWHADQASALSPGYRRYLQLSLSAALGGSASARADQKSAIQPDYVSSYTFAPSVVAAPGCDAAAALVVRGLGSGAKKVPVEITVSDCAATLRQTAQGRSVSYVADEAYWVQEEVQVGTRRETYQSGTHQVQCTKDSSLDGYQWVGLCDVPDYATRDVPVYETRDVEKHRDVTKYVNYTAVIHELRARVSGVVSIPWEDGTTLRVPFDQSAENVAETWHYVVPGHLATDPSTTFDRQLPPDFTTERILAGVAGGAGSEVFGKGTTEVREHRGRLALAAGKSAETAGDGATAEEQYVRSVMILGRADGDAASWLARTNALEAAQVTAILQGTDRPMPAPWSPPPAQAYASSGAPIGRDAFESEVGSLESEIGHVTTETYHRGVMPPNEIVDFHVGLAPFDVGEIGSRVAPQIGLDGHYGLLDMLGRYGPALHDQLGFRLTWGMTFARSREYENGKEEGNLAFTADAHYVLEPGVRFHHFGVFAGMSAGYFHATSGSTVGAAWYAQPAVHLTIRAFRTRNLVIDVSGFWSPLHGVHRKDQILLSFPVKDALDLQLFVQRVVVPGERRADSGEGRTDLGEIPVQMAGVQVGMRL